MAAMQNHGALVLTAPTGSGKTTQVPQMLLRHGVQGLILVLQPRRLAARLVARRVAAELDVEPGELVGYQTRHERVAGTETRILFITEGLFLRRLLSDPQLGGVGAVVLDEFHERSVAADLALGLCRQLRQSSRPDLRLVVMSATLDTSTVADYLDCPAVQAGGRTYDVHIDYDETPTTTPVWERAAAVLRQWLDSSAAHNAARNVLIFMPGAYEIRRTVEACQRRLQPGDGDIDVLPLHGALPAAAQDQAVRPGAHRKIIVSTNVAETSITIDGVGCVIDSGLARVHRHDPGRAVNALLVENISSASAQQRAGRAGRTAPGSCVRLWPHSEAHARPERDTPEVQRVDLADAVLHLRAFGVEAGTFGWLEPPPTQRRQQAETLLRDLGALHADGSLSALGRAMSDVPAHPRLACMLLAAAAHGVGERAGLWAALISEREICQRPLAARWRNAPDPDWASDLAVREQAFLAAKEARFDAARCSKLGLHVGACREVDRAARQFRAIVARLSKGTSADVGHLPATLSTNARLAACLLLAYGDHLALRRSLEQRTCEMEGRRRVVLERDSVVGDAPVLVVVEVREVEALRTDGGGVHTVVSMATVVDSAWLEVLFPHRVQRRVELQWDEQDAAVVEVEALHFGALALEPVRRQPTNRQAAAQVLVERLQDGRLRLEQWNDGVESWLARARCVAAWFPERQLLVYDAQDLAVIYSEIVGDAVRFGAIRRAPVLDHMRQAMSWADQQFVEQMAPERIRLPCGHGMKISYAAGEAPRGRARIQDFYDLAQTPRVAAGRVPVLLEILAPNFRPAQVTDDLPGFWERTYPDLRKELKRRYPKHEWR